MTSNSLDLATMFKAAAKTLKKNQESLNQADDFNHNHGDNMVETFKVITKAVESKKDAPPADQLSYASQVLRQKANSGSAAAYSDGLERAAQQFRGKQVTPDSAVDLISALMGGSGQTQSSSPAGGLIGSLLGSSSASSQPGSQSSDLLGSLIGGLTGGGPSQPSQQASGGIDTGDLINLTGRYAFLASDRQARQLRRRAVAAGRAAEGRAHGRDSRASYRAGIRAGGSAQERNASAGPAPAPRGSSRCGSGPRHHHRRLRSREPGARALAR